MSLDEILLTAEESMDKAVDYLKSETKGVRTGRATPALVEYVKVECYGAETDLRSVALISAPEAAQLLIKPFDPGTLQDIIKGIEKAGLGLNPQPDGKQIRINIPPLSGDRRNQLIASVKSMGEQAKVTVRNARRDANKAVDSAAKDKSAHISEDDQAGAKEEVQDLTKKYEGMIESIVSAKVKDVEEV